MNYINLSGRGIPPVVLYLYNAQATIRIVARLVSDEVANQLQYEFTCGNKVKMSLRGARKVKRQHNDKHGRHGAATIYKCKECGGRHVHSIFQRMDLVERLKTKILGKPTSKPTEYTHGPINVTGRRST